MIIAYLLSHLVMLSHMVLWTVTKVLLPSQNSGTWSRLEQHKPIFAEPKGKGDFVEVGVTKELVNAENMTKTYIAASKL